jgi:hypothetical protein
MESLSVFICPVSQLRWWCRGSRENSHCEARTHGLPEIDIANLAYHIIAFVVTRRRWIRRRRIPMKRADNARIAIPDEPGPADSRVVNDAE